MASAGMRGVEHLDAPALDQEDAVLRTALAEELRAAIEHPALARAQHMRDFSFRQSAEQVRRPAALCPAVGHQQRAELRRRAGLARSRRRLRWGMLADHGSARSQT
jgi:hypothetical protein